MASEGPKNLSAVRQMVFDGKICTALMIHSAPQLRASRDAESGSEYVWPTGPLYQSHQVMSRDIIAVAHDWIVPDMLPMIAVLL